MLMALGLAIGLIIGRLRRGRFLSLIEPGFRAVYLPVLGFGLQLIEMAFYRETGVSQYHGAVVFVSYGIILLFLALNSDYVWGCVLGALGTLSNLAVIAANGYAMPVGGNIAQFAGDTHQVNALGYVLAGEGTRLLPLGDVIPVPLPFIGGMASIGDFLLMAGVCLLVVEAMGKGIVGERVVS